MAARATRSTTRSASRAARLTGAVATGPLGALSHDELGVVFDGLADPVVFTGLPVGGSPKPFEKMVTQNPDISCTVPKDRWSFPPVETSVP